MPPHGELTKKKLSKGKWVLRREGDPSLREKESERERERGKTNSG
jgi:hypothetical protein